MTKKKLVVVVFLGFSVGVGIAFLKESYFRLNQSQTLSKNLIDFKSKKKEIVSQNQKVNLKVNLNKRTLKNQKAQKDTVKNIPKKNSDNSAN